MKLSDVERRILINQYEILAAVRPKILLQNSFRVLFLIADGAESLSGVSDTDRDADLSGQAGIGLGSADWQTNLASRFRF